MMKKHVITIAIASALLQSTLANAQNIVLTYKKTSPIASVQSASNFSEASESSVCVNVDGVNLCAKKKSLPTTMQNQSVVKSLKADFENATGSVTLALPDGVDLNRAMNAFQRTGEFIAVEQDVVVTNGIDQPKAYPDADIATMATYPSTTPNDTNFKEQAAYFASVSTNNYAVGVLDAWKKLATMPTISDIDIVVIDGGFLERTDLTYSSGYDFMTYNGNSRGPNFIEPNSDTCSGHGTGVSSVIGAQINNNQLIAGIVDKARIHAIKTMTCFRGTLSDTADALRWLGGEEFPGIPAYPGKPGVINMSLGGKINTCPLYMQEAINVAVAKGFSVVVSAGNENVDTSGFAPANCANVTTVGALDTTGARASFSNYGKEVTLTAVGREVVGLCYTENSYCYWDGTSFSSPIVAAGLALARQYAGLKAELSNVALSLSASPLANVGDCVDKGCGAGRLNMPALLDVASILSNQKSSAATYLLSKESKCMQQWLNKHAGKVKLCEVLRVTTPQLNIEGKTITYKLLAKLNSQNEWADFGAVLGGERQITVTELNEKLNAPALSSEIPNLQFKLSMCANGRCSDIMVDTSGLQADKAPVCN